AELEHVERDGPLRAFRLTGLDPRVQVVDREKSLVIGPSGPFVRSAHVIAHWRVLSLHGCDGSIWPRQVPQTRHDAGGPAFRPTCTRSYARGSSLASRRPTRPLPHDPSRLRASRRSDASRSCHRGTSP